MLTAAYEEDSGNTEQAAQLLRQAAQKGGESGWQALAAFDVRLGDDAGAIEAADHGLAAEESGED